MASAAVPFKVAVLLLIHCLLLLPMVEGVVFGSCVVTQYLESFQVL